MKNYFTKYTKNPFKYAPNVTKGAISGLDQDLMKELKATHYELGYDNDIGLTT